jgi:ABC-2 type transport system permease protein
VLWLGGHLMQRVYEGEIIDSRRLRQARAAPARVRPGMPTPRWLRPVPAPLLAVTLKELRYLWRDPQMKSALLGLAVPVLWLLVASRWRMSGPFMPAIIGAMFVYAGAPLAMNIFGYDREGLHILFLFPSDRRLLLIGKNVLGLVILIGVSAIGVTGGAAWLNQLGAVPKTLPFLVAASFVNIAAGNLTSVYFPLRVVARGESPFSRSTEKGCMIHTLRALLFQAMLLASLPIVAGFLTPHFLNMPALYLVTAPVSVLYGAAVYAIVLPYATSALLRRETRLIEICTATEEM